MWKDVTHHKIVIAFYFMFLRIIMQNYDAYRFGSLEKLLLFFYVLGLLKSSKGPVDRGSGNTTRSKGSFTNSDCNCESDIASPR